MREVRSLTFRLLPCTRAKAEALSRLAGACRWVWNEMLDQQNQLHAMCRMNGAKTPSPTFFTLGRAFTQLRRSVPWLQELPFSPVRYALKYQADAWKRYFSGTAGRPKFKARHGDDAVTIPQGVVISGGRIRIPKLGWYVLRRRGGNPYPDGVAKQARIRRVSGRWYCTVAYEVECEEAVDNGLAIGIDRNVGQIAVSTGDLLFMPDTSRLEARKRRYQRMMARRRKGSNRRKRAKILAARTARKIATVRKDWQHQVSRQCADTASEVVIENLNVRGMSETVKPLNRGIRDSGWHGLEKMIGYKAHTLTKVDPRHTSQTCSSCGYRDRKNRRTQSEFRCAACGHESSADVNAALNVLALGTGASGRRGALALATPLNRQEMYAGLAYG